MSSPLLSAEAIRRALTLRDLTDPAHGPHAMQLLIDDVERALVVSVRRVRMHPIVSVEENYDKLRIARDAVSRDARYTRYVNDQTILRTHATAMIPALLQDLASYPPDDVVVSCPGLVYRRDAIDRQHVGEPHQLDLWRIRATKPALDAGDLEQMIATVIEALLPGSGWRTVPASHPYTTDGRQIDVASGDGWMEVGECGLAHPEILVESGLRDASGLAMGLGLDRILMLRKAIPDIRLLRSEDPRVVSQMLDLEPYRTVSSMPPVRRDMSIAVDGDPDVEQVGDRVREALEEDAEVVEEVAVLSSTPAENLPAPARERLGIVAGQRNLLIRVVLRPIDRTLTDDEANGLRDRIYAALHQGTVHSWASGPPGPA